MLKKLICKIAGHHPWVCSNIEMRDNDDCKDVYLIQLYGDCKRCGVHIPPDRKEFLGFKFHPVTLAEPIQLTQKIDKFE